eukprot:COSAG01_NODE_485_length_16397_cov_48.193827_16_plen_232_part_00
MAHAEGGGSSGDLHASGGGSSGPAVTAAVSCFCALIGLPCLSHCVHGASIGGGSDRHPSQAPDDEQPPAGQRGDQVGLLSSALPCRVMRVPRGALAEPPCRRRPLPRVRLAIGPACLRHRAHDDSITTRRVHRKLEALRLARQPEVLREGWPVWQLLACAGASVSARRRRPAPLNRQNPPPGAQLTETPRPPRTGRPAWCAQHRRADPRPAGGAGARERPTPRHHRRRRRR